MSDSEEVPAYVTYTNGIVKESLDGVSAQIERMSEVLATKAEVTLLEYKLTVSDKAREELAALVTADIEERKAKGRRLWLGVWGVFALTVTSTITLIAAHFHF